MLCYNKGAAGGGRERGAYRTPSTRAKISKMGTHNKQAGAREEIITRQARTACPHPTTKQSKHAQQEIAGETPPSWRGAVACSCLSSSLELVDASLLLGGQLVLELLEEVRTVLVELACQTAKQQQQKHRHKRAGGVLRQHTHAR